MQYKKMFDTAATGIDNNYEGSGPTRLADRTSQPIYEYTPEIELAVNVALATARPLLVRGASGAGKSSLARAVAHHLGWRYYETTITSRSSAQDLLWTFDSLRRLNDARDPNQTLQTMGEYIKPGALWWAFDRRSAAKVGKPDLHGPQPDVERAVVLIDEIDKAEPDVPNNLLIPIGSLRFYVDDLNLKVEASPEHPPLIIITTNEERQLASAFMRRCVMLELPPPDAARLEKIATQHFGPRSDALYALLAQQMVEAARQGERPAANAAEYLDAVLACVSLGVRPPFEGETPSPIWRAIRETTLLKTAEKR